MTSPFRSRPKSEPHNDEDEHSDTHRHAAPSKNQKAAAATTATAEVEEKKGIWNWKPMRALSHIGMHRMGCLFSVEAVTAQGLPTSMNGLRLAVTIRKKETKDGAVQTMPARVLRGSADFEETLFIRCHVYCSGGAGTGKPIKFEPRPFLISAIAIDAPELDFGKNTVDLTMLVKESMEKSLVGQRVRQWDIAFPLAGKAKGGELVVKLGFQIMEDGGVGIYNQAEVSNSGNSGSSSASFARKQSKTSFSVTSPKVTRSEPSITPTGELSSADLKGIDDFSLDEPGPPEVRQEVEAEAKGDELELPEFDVIDKGVEVQDEKEKEEEGKKEDEEDAEADGEVVKEVVHDSAHLWRLNELEAIANQIKALESMMLGGVSSSDQAATMTEEADETARLDAEEETVTREFLQMLEQEEDGKEQKLAIPLRQVSSLKASTKVASEADIAGYIPDLGKGLGPVVQTRDGGYLAAMNPFDIPVARKETPKLAMQFSKPFIFRDHKPSGGAIELFQWLCVVGCDELCAKLSALSPMDELMGKTAEQIAFEGMASAIITGRSKELGASSTAARSVAVLRTMATATSEGRKERILTGLWNVHEEPVTLHDILAFALQKMEAMAVEALKIESDMTDEQAPFDVSPVVDKSNNVYPLDSTVPLEEWESSCTGADAVTMLVIVQLRDPLRRYETVGAPSIVIIQAAQVDKDGDGNARYKVVSMHVAGLRLRAAERRSVWDGEKQRLTAMQWLVAYGLGKAGRKARVAAAKGGHDMLWSMSSRVMANMWLKPMRNPDVKIPQK